MVRSVMSASAAVVLSLVCWGAQGATLGATNSETLPDSAVFAVDPPWLAVFRCFQSVSPSTCFQNRAVRAIEDLLPDDDDSEDKSSEDDLPKEVSPVIGRIIDRIGDFIASGISQWYPDTDPEGLESAKSSNALEEARGHKKKKKVVKKVKKVLKKMIVNILLFVVVLQQAGHLFLYGTQTFIMFKLMLFAGVWVISQVVKTYALVSWKIQQKQAPNFLHVEPQIKHITQHHTLPTVFEEPHVTHQEHFVPETYEYDHPLHSSDELGSYNHWARRSDNAQRLAYHQQIPAGAK